MTMGQGGQDAGEPRGRNAPEMVGQHLGQSAPRPAALESCDHCDGSGGIWESCGCYQCEYSGEHDRYIECGNCGGSGRVQAPNREDDDA